jgi:subtilisin family serine protease
MPLSNLGRPRHATKYIASFLISCGFLTLIACGTPDQLTAPPFGSRQALAIAPSSPRARLADQYIVTLAAVEVDVKGAAKELITGAGGEVLRTYSSALRGFSARIPATALEKLKQSPRILAIEPDQLIETQETSTSTAVSWELESPVPSWGLDRIDQAKNRLDSKYSYVSAAGAGVNVYIVDTGIRLTHTDFGGRAFEAFTTVNDSLGAGDCRGHGTHVAGTVGGAVYGVAKKVRLFSVRVLPCDGSAPMSDLIAALDWIAQNRELPAVVNISLGGEQSNAANEAVAGVVASGAVVVVAAGNDLGDACEHSPASAASALTVGASNVGDMRSGWSNFGPCVDLFAPGSSISSDYFGTDTSMVILSGTSMATPHVSGAAALYLSIYPTASPVQVASAILGTATRDILTNLDAESPNLLLYTGDFSAWAPTPDSSTTPAPTPIDNPPTATFFASCWKLSCVFTASASTDDVGITTYAWNFGDGTTSASISSAATHSYRAGGTYTVTLTVTDTKGHVAKTSKLVRAKRR